MITKEEAFNSITEIGEYERWNTGTYDKKLVDKLIDKIYDSIGTCKDCKHADKIEKSTLLDCEYFENVTPNFYCGNFEKNQNDK